MAEGPAAPRRARYQGHVGGQQGRSPLPSCCLDGRSQGLCWWALWCHDRAFGITGPLWGESTGNRWIPLTKGQWYGVLVFGPGAHVTLPYWALRFPRCTEAWPFCRLHFQMHLFKTNCWFVTNILLKVATDNNTVLAPTMAQCLTVSWNYDSPVHLGINTLRPRQNGRHFADDIFKCIFLNENVWIPVKISLRFVPKCPINNIPALV